MLFRIKFFCISNSIYMDYNATTPLDPEVIQAVTEAMHEAWGNPSSSYTPGKKAKELINWSRDNIAQLVGGRSEDIIFTSGGTEANNIVFYTAIKHFWDSHHKAGMNSAAGGHDGNSRVFPHIITSNVEHDSVSLTADNLVKEGKAQATFLPVSKVTGCIEVDDVIAAVRPTTCLISVMLANNETGILMPVAEISQQVKTLNQNRDSELPRILLHTDAAQAIGKVRVDVHDLGVDYLTIVGHKFYGPRIGALYVKRPGTSSPLHPMFFGGGQERNFRPGKMTGTNNFTEYSSHMREVKDYLEEKLLATFGKEKLNFNSHFKGSDRLPNTCNVSILGPNLKGQKVLLNCQRLLASVGAACHSDQGDRPSRILLTCGIPHAVAINALRISVGRTTSKADVDIVVEDLKQAVNELEGFTAQAGQ
uniref:Selenocysteine lyase n=1 Tax=Callorhinchus milii TaxID=7868 RepID=A0A4W3IUH2_CALMI